MSTPLLPSSRLPYSRYSLRSRRHQFSLPQLNTALYRNMFISRCLFQYISLYNLSSFSFVFNFVISLFYVVLKVQVSSLFVKGYLTWLEWSLNNCCEMAPHGFLSIGLLTVTDFIRILCHYYRTSKVCSKFFLVFVCLFVTEYNDTFNR